jgi:hypothetical protein
MFLLLVLANLALQLDVSETFFNRLFNKNTQTRTSTSYGQPVCGSKQFWARTNPAAFVSQITTTLAISSFSGKVKNGILVSNLFSVDKIQATSYSRFKERPRTLLFVSLHSGLSPPFKT